MAGMSDAEINRLDPGLTDRLASHYLAANTSNEALTQHLIANHPLFQQLGGPQKSHLKAPPMMVHGGPVSRTNAPPTVSNFDARAQFFAKQEAQKTAQQKYASNQVGKLLADLQSTHGMTDQQARAALATELLQGTKAHAPDKKNVHYSQTFLDPTTYAVSGKDGAITAKSKAADPLLAKTPKGKKEAFANLTTAAFMRSPLGQVALRSSDPKIQAAAFKAQYSQQSKDTFDRVAGKDGLADAYDAWSSAKRAAAGMTAAQARAAGLTSAQLAEMDPLKQLGLDDSSLRTWLGIQKGTVLDGMAIKAAAARKLDAERASIASGYPQPGSDLGEVLKSLSLTTSGKQLANVFTNLSLPQALQGVFGLEAELSTGNVTMPQVLGATGKPSSSGVAAPQKITPAA